MADRIRLELRQDWMRRPHFGPECPRSLKAGDAARGWVDDGMHCPALAGFLREPTAGLFLVAGPRGIGKTSLVRHWASRLERPVHLVDAADLGLYEAVQDEHLERTLLVGLFRALCDSMMPRPRPRLIGRGLKWRGTLDRLRRIYGSLRRSMLAFDIYLLRLIDPILLRISKCDVSDGAKGFIERLSARVALLSGARRERVKAIERALPPGRDQQRFWEDLYQLTDCANADSYERRHTDAFTGDASATAKLKRVPIVLNAGLRHARESSTQIAWTNNTDALRAEFRNLLQAHADQPWPVLILDEWDRFGDTGSQREIGVARVLQALARLKSLLADYPAPVVVVGGEDIYHEVRRNPPARPQSAELGGQDVPLEVTNRYANIFNQRCFLSPLPAWHADGAVPLLAPYLSALLKDLPLRAASRKAESHIRKKLAEFLLLEVGADPHALKVWVGRNLSLEEGVPGSPVFLSPPWDMGSELKAIMGRVVAAELRRWEAEYGAVLVAGPYRRSVWLRYIRGRMLAYWRHARRPGPGRLCLPVIEYSEPAIPLEFLNRLEAGATAEETVLRAGDLSERAQLQALSLDAALLKQLYVAAREDLLSQNRATEDYVTEDYVKDSESDDWEDWIAVGLFPWMPQRAESTALLRGTTEYDLRGFKS